MDFFGADKNIIGKIFRVDIPEPMSVIRIYINGIPF
jgi:hypothetical protein